MRGVSAVFLSFVFIISSMVPFAESEAQEKIIHIINDGGGPGQDYKNGSGTPEDPYIIENRTFNGTWGTSQVLVNEDNFIIRNCTFINTSETGLLILGVENVTIENCTFINCTIGIETTEDTISPYDKCVNISIISCRFKNIRSFSVYIKTSEYVRIENANIYGSQIGIFIVESEYISIDDNRISNSSAFGIKTVATKDLIIQNNSVINSGKSGVDDRFSYFVMENNIISEAVTGISLYSSNFTIIRAIISDVKFGIYSNNGGGIYNSSIDAACDGIHIYYSDIIDFKIINNTILSGSDGIKVSGSKGNISENIIECPGYGIWLESQSSYKIPIYNNKLRNSTINPPTVGFDTEIFTKNTIDGEDILLINGSDGMTISNRDDIPEIIIQNSNNISLDNLSDVRSIFILDGMNHSISNCLIGNSKIGTSVVGSANITENTFFNNTESVYEYSYGKRYHLNITDNVIRDSGIAINYTYSRINISHNRMYNCSIFNSGELVQIPKIHNNSVNGLPVLFVKHTNDITINDSHQYGQIISIDCYPIEIRDIVMKNGSYGILNIRSWLTVRNCNFIGFKRAGIYTTDILNVINSTFSDNMNGVFSNNGYARIFDSVLINNSGYGLYLRPSMGAYNPIQDNRFEGNGIGIKLMGWSADADITIRYNLFLFNHEYGIYAYSDSNINNNYFIENNNGSGQLLRGAKQAAGYYDSPFNNNYWSEMDHKDTDGDGITDINY